MTEDSHLSHPGSHRTSHPLENYEERNDQNGGSFRFLGAMEERRAGSRRDVCGLRYGQLMSIERTRSHSYCFFNMQ